MDQPDSDDNDREHVQSNLERVAEEATLGIARLICGQQNIPVNVANSNYFGSSASAQMQQQQHYVQPPHCNLTTQQPDDQQSSHQQFAPTTYPTYTEHVHHPANPIYNSVHPIQQQILSDFPTSSSAPSSSSSFRYYGQQNIPQYDPQYDQQQPTTSHGASNQYSGHDFDDSNRIAESGFQQQQPINRDFLVPPMPFDYPIEDDDIIFIKELAPAAQQNAPVDQQQATQPPIRTPRYPPIHNRQVKQSVELYVQWTLEYPGEEGEESMNKLVEKVVEIIGENFSTLRERLKDRVSRCKKRIMAERRQQQQQQQTLANNNDNGNANHSQSTYTLAQIVVPEQQQIVQGEQEEERGEEAEEERGEEEEEELISISHSEEPEPDENRACVGKAEGILQNFAAAEESSDAEMPFLNTQKHRNDFVGERWEKTAIDISCYHESHEPPPVSTPHPHHGNDLHNEQQQDWETATAASFSRGNTPNPQQCQQQPQNGADQEQEGPDESEEIDEQLAAEPEVPLNESAVAPMHDPAQMQANPIVLNIVNMPMPAQFARRSRLPTWRNPINPGWKRKYRKCAPNDHQQQLDAAIHTIHAEEFGIHQELLGEVRARLPDTEEEIENARRLELKTEPLQFSEFDNYDPMAVKQTNTQMMEKTAEEMNNAGNDAENSEDGEEDESEDGDEAAAEPEEKVVNPKPLFQLPHFPKFRIFIDDIREEANAEKQTPAQTPSLKTPAQKTPSLTPAQKKRKTNASPTKPPALEKMKIFEEKVPMKLPIAIERERVDSTNSSSQTQQQGREISSSSSCVDSSTRPSSRSTERSWAKYEPRPWAKYEPRPLRSNTADGGLVNLKECGYIMPSIAKSLENLPTCKDCNVEFGVPAYPLHMLSTHGTYVGGNKRVLEYMRGLNEPEFARIVWRCERCGVDCRTLGLYVEHCELEEHIHVVGPNSRGKYTHRDVLEMKRERQAS